MKAIVIGDVFVDPEFMKAQAGQLEIQEPLEIVTYNWENSSKEKFTERAHNIEVNGPEAEDIPEELYEEIIDTDIVLTHFCPIPGRLIKKGKNLKLIGTCRAGLEHIDVEEATKNNIPVVHCIRNAQSVADFVLGLIYAETRNIARAHKYMMDGRWVKDYSNSNYTTTINQLRIGLVGLGYIGRIVVKQLNALGVEVWGTDPFVSQEELDREGLRIKKVSLEDLFSGCDVVSLHLRLNDNTKNLVNAELLSRMKKNAYLINTSRAGVINQDDLLEFLEQKRIAGAALDVWWEEPLPVDSKFLNLDNLTMTPHIAGDTVDAIPMSPKLLVQEINKYLRTGKNSMVVNLNQIKSLKI